MRSILNFFTRNANQPEVAGQINDRNDDTTGEDAAESDNGNNSVEHEMTIMLMKPTIVGRRMRKM